MQPAFARAGAYGRFQALLGREEQLPEWYAFEAAAQREALRGWCEEVGLEVCEGGDVGTESPD